MQNSKNYVVVYYNKPFHDKPLEEKKSQLKAFFDKWNIKNICFDTKNHKPMAFVYFKADGAASNAYQARCNASNSYGFKVQLGVDKVVQPCELEPESATPRSIIIDGDNVARTHGLDRLFSSRGLKLAIEYFENLGHVDVKAVVPEQRLTPSRSEPPVLNPTMLQDLKSRGLIIPIKEGIYDDKVIIDQAMRRFAVIVSNDKFTDEQFRTKPNIAQYLNEPNILPYVFSEDDFITTDATLQHTAEYILNRPKNVEIQSLISKTSALQLENETHVHETQQESSQSESETDGETSHSSSELDSTFTQIYVKCMSKAYDKRAIQKLFEHCGQVKSVSIFTDSSGQPTGCCAINFADNQSAKKAVDQMNSYRLDNSVLKVEPYRARQPFKPLVSDSTGAVASNRLFVGFIDINSCTKDDLIRLFEPYGELEEADINKERKFAFIKYKEQSSADEAIKDLNGKSFTGISAPYKCLKVNYMK